MSSDNQINLNEENTFVSDEDTEISVPPAVPNFETAQAAPVQPVIPVVPVPGDVAGAFPQQPQVVYVAQPTIVEPKRSWGWIPAALALLIVATIAGVFIGAELYKRSIYAESATPNSPGDVSPYANSTANENKSAKTDVENTLAGKKENGSVVSVKSADDKSETRQINSVSTGFAPIQKTDLRENGRETESADENEGNNLETADLTNEEIKKAEENKAVKRNQQTLTDDEDAPPPPPVQRKSKDSQPKKVENEKDTQNIEPPQRNIIN